MILEFGKHKGKDLKEIPTDYLMWLIEKTDVNHPRFGAKNKTLVDACHDALNAQADQKPGKNGALKQNVSSKTLDPKLESMIADLQKYIDELYKTAEGMRVLVDVYQKDGTIRPKATPF